MMCKKIAAATMITTMCFMAAVPTFAKEESKAAGETIVQKLENGEQLDFSEIKDEIEYNFNVFDEEGYEVPVILLKNGMVIDNNGYAVTTNTAASYKLKDGEIVYMYNPVTTTFDEWADAKALTEEEVKEQKESESVLYAEDGKEIPVIQLKNGDLVDTEGYLIDGYADGAHKMHSGKIVFDFNPTEISLEDWLKQ